MTSTPVNIVGLITARGGSKGIPRKNLVEVGGRPLIDWTIEAAKGSRYLTSIALSTDSAEIADHACALGVEVPFLREAALARDDSSHVDVVEDFCRRLAVSHGSTPDYICLLQPTSPFRQAGDIDAAIELMLENRAEACVSVCESKDHPMVSHKLDEAGRLVPFIDTGKTYLRRQDLPAAYVLNGAVYVIAPEALSRHRTFVPPGTVPSVMPRERSLDLDTPFDRHLADILFRQPFLA